MAAKKTKRRTGPKLPAVGSDYVFSYKDIDVLKRYVSEQGYIVGRERSGLSQKQQNHMAQAVKRARHLALLPFTQTI